MGHPIIVDHQGLADVLAVSPKTVAKFWREYPHFYVGTGQNLKSARFDVADVIDYLKGRDYDRLEGQPGAVGVKIPFPESAVQKGRLRQEIRRGPVGSGKAAGTGSAGRDPFNLLP